MKTHNPRVAKLHRAYTTEQAARLFGAHRNTVRAWIKAGLATVAGRPLLIEGRELRAFLERRRVAAKRPCAPGTLYCCKCRSPRPPGPRSVVFETRDARAGSLRAICATCGTRMFQRARQERLAAVMPGIAILIVKAPARIAECSPSSPKRA